MIVFGASFFLVVIGLSSTNIKTTELSANVIAWEEGEPALQLLAPEQAMTAVVFSRLGQVFFLTEDGRVYLLNLKQDGLEEDSL